jgi:hypothetical protein
LVLQVQHVIDVIALKSVLCLLALASDLKDPTASTDDDRAQRNESRNNLAEEYIDALLQDDTCGLGENGLNRTGKAILPAVLRLPRYIALHRDIPHFIKIDECVSHVNERPSGPDVQEDAPQKLLRGGDFTQAAVIAGLLIFNAVIGLYQEGKAHKTLEALKSRLALNASVRRDGAWTVLPSSVLVPGDAVKLSLGSVVPADLNIVDGSVLLDQSSLTGESEPVEVGAGIQAFAGALVQRGEATGQVVQTGPRTKFGNSAELVRNAHVVSSQQKVVLRVVRNIAMFNVAVLAVLVGYAVWRGLTWSAIVPLVLTAVLAAIPVALPATFTLAAALVASTLGKLGVLPTRRSTRPRPWICSASTRQAR